MKTGCIQSAIEKFYGHKKLKFLTPFEIACWAILAQRIPMYVARKKKENIVNKLGGRSKVKGIKYHFFPDSSTIEAVSSELPELLPNNRKSEYLSADVTALCIVDEQGFRTAPHDEDHDWLTDIKGMGDWSANL